MLGGVRGPPVEDNEEERDEDGDVDAADMIEVGNKSDGRVNCLCAMTRRQASIVVSHCACRTHYTTRSTHLVTNSSRD